MSRASFLLPWDAWKGVARKDVSIASRNPVYLVLAVLPEDEKRWHVHYAIVSELGVEQDGRVARYHVKETGMLDDLMFSPTLGGTPQTITARLHDAPLNFALSDEWQIRLGWRADE